MSRLMKTELPVLSYGRKPLHVIKLDTYNWALTDMLDRLKRRRGLMRMDNMYSVSAELLWDVLIEFYLARGGSRDPRKLPRMANLAVLMEDKVHVV